MKTKTTRWPRSFAPLAIALLSVLLVFSIIIDFISSLDEGLRDETNKTLQEVAAQSALRIKDRIKGDMAQLGDMARMLADLEYPILSPETEALLAREAGFATFDRIYALPTDGNVPAGSILSAYNFTGDSAFRQATDGKAAVTFSTNPENGHHSLLMYTPIVRDGVVCGVLMGHYYVPVIGELLQTSYFDGKGYSYLANCAGEVLIRSDHPSSDPNFIGIQRDFEKIELHAPDHISQVLADMQGGRSGSLFYRWNGSDRIMSYTPIDVNDWYLLTVVPQDVVRARSTHMFRQAVIFVIILSAVMILLMLLAMRQRIRNQRDLSEAHREIISLYNALPGGVFRCRYDPHWTVLFANEGFYRFLGYTKEEFRDRFQNRMTGVIYPEDLEGIAKAVGQQIKSSNIVVHENRLVCADGSVRWIWINSEFSLGEPGQSFFDCTFVDITQRRLAEEQALLNQQRYDIIMDQSYDTIFEWSLRDLTIYHTKNFRIKFGYEPCSENFPHSAEKHVHPDDRAIYYSIYSSLQDGKSFSTGEFRLLKSDGVYLWCRVSVTAIRDSGGKPWKAVGILVDIDEQKRMLEQVQESAKRDPLTRLYNKGASELLINEYLSHACAAAILMLDADNFKSINDTYGHSVGDEVLRELSCRLSGHFRDTDLVGRIGGDEFVVFLNNVSEPSALASKAAAIIESFERPLCLDENPVEITCSMGIARFPDHGKTYAELIRHADYALYKAKHKGKNQFCFYSDD